MLPLPLELRRFNEKEETNTMTKVSMPLEALFEKGEDADSVREMIAFMAHGTCGWMRPA